MAAQTARYGRFGGLWGTVGVERGARPVEMHLSDGTAQPLVAADGFGADVIRFGPGEGVDWHTHVGAHILFVQAGAGWLGYEEEAEAVRLEPGICYLVPSNVRHRIAAETELIMLAVGNDHQPADSPTRLIPDAG